MGELTYIGVVSEFDNKHNKIRERTVEAKVSTRLETDPESGALKIVLTNASETVHADTQYEYENPSSVEFPRIVKIIHKGLKAGEADRATTIGSYFSAGGVKTMLPLSSTDEKGITSVFTYDNNGYPTSEGVAGRITSYSNYDSYGNLGKITTPDGISGSFTYNALGDVETSSGPNGTTQIEYNNKRQIAKTTLTGSGITSPIVSQIFYDDAGNVVRTIDPEGLESSTTWTAQQKKLTDTAGTGVNAQTTTYVYDLADRQIGTIYNDGKSVNLTLDAAGQALAAKISGKTTTMEYDNLGHNIKTTSPLGISVSHAYDALGNKVSTTDGRGKTVNFAYNAFGEQTSITNRNGNTFEMSLDIANRKSALKTPMGKTNTQNFAPNTWDLTSIVPPSGASNKTEMAYDASGRLSEIADPTGRIIYAYNSANGLLEKITEGADEISYAYDSIGRVKSSTAEGLTVSYAYTNGGKIKTVTYPAQNGISAKTVNYEYDDSGRLLKVRDWANRETTYSHDNMNRLTQILRPNGSKRTLTYNANTGLLARIEERKPDGIPIMIHVYNYDNDNRLTSNLRAPKDIKIDRASFNASYNKDNQLSTWNWMGESPMSVTPSYDADGNMTHGPVGEAAESDYVYDTRNRLLSCNGVIYTYDAEDNRRSLITLDEDANPLRYNYVYNRSGELSEALIRNKTVTVNGVDKTVSTYYVYGAGLEYEIAFDESGNEVDEKYYHSDQVGSTIALTNASGAITDRYSYDTWGYVKHTQGTSDTPFLYVGAFGVQTDTNGLVNMRARYYNPTTQTFINPDPLGFGGGLNWYAYASGDPLTRVDANGMFDTGIGYRSTASIFSLSSIVNTINYHSTSVLNTAQTVLSGLGMLPVVGPAFDFANAGISIARGNYGDAAFHAFAAIPGIGDAFAAGKMALGAAKAVGVTAAISKTAMGVGGGIVAKSTMSGVAKTEAKMVQVTSWASIGVKPDLNSGRWVMKGAPSKINYALTGLSGPKITLDPLSYTSSQHVYSNFVTGQVPASSLKWPKGWEKIKGFFGQRIME